MRTDYTAINARTISVAGMPIAGSGTPGAGSYTTFDQLDADVVLYLNGSLIQGTPYPGMIVTNFNDINVLSGLGLADIVKYGSASSAATNSATGPLLIGSNAIITPPDPSLPLPGFGAQLSFEPVYANMSLTANSGTGGSQTFTPWTDTNDVTIAEGNYTNGAFQQAQNASYVYKMTIKDDGLGWSGDSYDPAGHQRAEFQQFGNAAYAKSMSFSHKVRVNFGGGFLPNDSNFLSLCQMQHVPDSGKQYWSAPFYLNLRNDGLYAIVNVQPDGSKDIQGTPTAFGPFPFPIGSWNDIDGYVVYGPSGNGTLVLDINGVRYLEKLGNIGIGYVDAAANDIFIKHGVYRTQIAVGSGKSISVEYANVEYEPNNSLLARKGNPLPVNPVIGPQVFTATYGKSNAIPILGLTANETVTSATGGTLSGNSLVVSPYTNFTPTITTSTGRTLPIAVTTPLPTHALLDGMEDTTGVTVTTAALTFALDNTRRLSGSSSISLTGKSTGDMGSFFKTNVFNGDPTGLGTVFFAIRNEVRDPGLLSVVFPRLRNGSTTSSAATANMQPKPGWFYVTKHVSDYSPALTVNGQYDFVATFNSGGFPAADKINIDVVAANTNGIPTIVLECDDSLVGQTGSLKDDLIAASTAAGLATPMRATLYVAPGKVGVGAGQSTLAAIRACRDAGWGISCDGRSDDTQMVSAANVEAAMNDSLGLNKVRQYLRDNDLLDGKGGENHFCYPNGSTWGQADGSRVPNSPVAAATSDGASPFSTLTFGAAPTRAVAVNDVYYGFGPTNLTVKTVNGSAGTSVTLNGVVPAGTYKVLFQDESGPFQFGQLPERAATEGFLTGRISAGEPQGFSSRYGVGDMALYQTTLSLAGATFATIKAYIDSAVKLGNTVRMLIHGYDNGAYLNIDRTVAQQVWAYAASLIAAGQLTWPTSAEWYTRDCATPAPLPGRTTGIIKPAKPTVAVAPGSSQAVLTITDGAAGSSPITGHDLFRSSDVNAPRYVGPITLTGNNYTDTGLTPGTTYTYQIATISLDGSSIRSNPITVTPTA